MSTDSALRVASWPGKSKAHNPFLNIFLGGLEAAGCDVDSVASLDDLPRAIAAKPDILLIHWAERVYQAQSRWQALSNIRTLLRALDRRPEGTRAVWLVHNLEPHDARRFQKLVWPHYIKALTRRIDGMMTLAPGTVPLVQQALPALAGKPAKGLWHPAYRAAGVAPILATGWLMCLSVVLTTGVEVALVLAALRMVLANTSPQTPRLSAT